MVVGDELVGYGCYVGGVVGVVGDGGLELWYFFGDDGGL